ncbi:hypothetical protein BDV27DRAFT_149889 [Aspergillus caelatus]|uniref:Uncharacterized protein n=1 Tax=Aspergillus caelatus TaxID=61420 RepID=A0A5N6ZNT9_9EURO|nr:uncharacterized protein BDV27DRAFT_149889 [Aspergillus caelatus]KAE8359105.1 hypothetical protein BDV27DRAFT_149889 [Aspergillus caelatus]
MLEPNRRRPSLYLVYLAWVDAWMSLSERPDVGVIEAPLSLKELSRVLIASNRFELLKEKNLTTTIQSFKTHYKTGNIKLGGAKSATCEETDLLSERYDPRTPCHCDGDIPYQQIKSLVISGDSTKCQTVESTVRAMKEIRARPDEWNSTDIFTVESLGDAIHELVWANMEIHTELDTCKGPGTGREIPTVQAPDRRPHPVNDTSPEVSSQLYPTSESIKLCADAKHYFAMAAGASGCDYGLARAIADSGNDILIGDYCEAADETTLTLLWQSGAAAIAFLKLCNLSGLMTNWQFNNLMAGILQFRALGYYRDHSRLRLPDGLYGSRMTNLTTHRYIDLGLFNAVVPASLTTGEQLTKHQYSELVKACALINDLVDFRSDIKRKQRENVVLRGLRGNVCNYLDELIGDCLDTTASLLETSRLCALVLMGFCNWSIMSSHHKVYELMKGMELDTNTPLCQYTSTDNESKRKRLLNALAPFGTLGKEGPNVRRRRFELDKLYATCIGNKRRHSAWLADISRSLLCPGTLRTLVDVVHYQWEGQAGDVEYCP